MPNPLLFIICALLTISYASQSNFNPRILQQDENLSCSQRPTNCDHVSIEASQPVCGSLYSCFEDGRCQKTYKSSCHACLDSNVISIELGVCYDEPCDTENRPKSSQCSRRYSPVCATSSEGTTKIYENLCLACAENSTISIEEGLCVGGDDQTQYCSNLVRIPGCEQEDNPTCAVFDECIFGICSSTVKNPCTACANGLSKYLPGRCEDQKTYCNPNNRPSSCYASVDYVCSYFREGCSEGICTRTDSHPCGACLHDSVIYYTKGQCLQEVASTGATAQCDRSIQSSCLDIYEPVCVVVSTECGFENCNQRLTMPNSCEACNLQNVENYTIGACKFSCEEEFYGVTDCSKSPLDPVCGFPEGCSSEDCQKSFENACIACTKGGMKTYELGMCSGGYKHLKCTETDLAPSCLAEKNEPVCGSFQEDCYDSTCRKTFANSCSACKVGGLFSYEPGLCENDSGIPCELTNRPQDCFGALIENVCGYSKASCESEDCRKTFESGCEACKDPTIFYYTLDQCPGDDVTSAEATVQCDSTIQSSSCEDIYEPVCAVVSMECGFENCNQRLTMPNKCEACNFPHVQNYTIGACKFSCEEEFYGVTDCSKSPFEPVCGFPEGCSSEDCQKSFENACIACTKGEMKTYELGMCSGGYKHLKCTEIELAPNCLSEETEPVCGNFQEDCSDSSCRRTFTNSCSACKVSGLVSYQPGSCEGDNIIPCELTNRPNNCSEAAAEAVCGYSQTSCENGGCRKTFGSGCEACKDPTTLYYKLDKCVGDEGVPCDQNNRPTSCDSSLSEHPVCGYYEVGCTDETCRMTFMGSCRACTDPSVFFYLPRACPGDSAEEEIDQKRL